MSWGKHTTYSVASTPFTRDATTKTRLCFHNEQCISLMRHSHLMLLNKQRFLPFPASPRSWSISALSILALLLISAAHLRNKATMCRSANRTRHKPLCLITFLKIPRLLPSVCHYSFRGPLLSVLCLFYLAAIVFLIPSRRWLSGFSGTFLLPRQSTALSPRRDCVARQLWELGDRVQMAGCTEHTPSVIAHS